jgi:hypothetical protein
MGGNEVVIRNNVETEQEEVLYRAQCLYRQPGSLNSLHLALRMRRVFLTVGLQAYYPVSASDIHMIYFVDLAFYLKFTSLCIFNK